jgi:hypothetical protein
MTERKAGAKEKAITQSAAAAETLMGEAEAIDRRGEAVLYLMLYKHTLHNTT